MAPIGSSYITITADFSVFRDSVRRHAREAGEDAARGFSRSFATDMRTHTGNNLQIDVQPRLDLRVFLPQWRAFAATFLNRVWEIHVQPNMDPNHLRWLMQQGTNTGQQIGGNMAGGMAGALRAQLSGLMGPVGLVLAAAIIGVAAPAIAAGISGAILLAVGGGILAAGIASAARDPAVKAAFEPLKRTASTVFTEMGMSFKGPLISALGIFEDALQDMRPMIRETFGIMAEVVEPLARGLADMAKNSMPGIRDAAAAAKPLFDAIAEKLPELGEALSEFLTQISEGGPGATQFFKDLFSFLIVTLPIIGDLLGGIGNAWQVMRGQSVLAMAAVLGTWMLFKAGFELVSNIVSGGLSLLGKRFGEFRDGVSTAVNGVRSAWDAGWAFVRDRVFNPMMDFIQVKVPHAFRYGVDTIEFWWNRIKDVAKVPIRFVIDTVINKGIIGTFNTVAGFLPGLDKIPTVPLPQGFAAGGYFDGRIPGAPSDDDNMVAVGPGGKPIGLASGEYVVRARQTAKHLPLLEAINSGVDGFADGGIIGAILNPAGWVGDRVNSLIGAIPGGGFLASAGAAMARKFVGALVAFVKDKLSFAGAGGQAPAGFPPWPSGPGAQRGDSGVWRLITALIRSTGPVSGTFGNGYRPGDPLWHGSGRAVDWMGFNQDALASFLAVRRPLELIHRTNSRDYAYTRGVNKGSFNNSLMEAHRNHVHIAMALGGLVKGWRPRVMDTGGWMMPGWNPPTYNGTGAPERVTPAGAEMELSEATINKLARAIARALTAGVTSAREMGRAYA